jgi:hypothetical protein
MLQALIGPVTGLLDKFIEDKDQKNKLAHELATMADNHAQELAKGQLAINAEEAKSRNIFVSGWRPSVGWCCSLALFAHFLVFPTMDVVTAYMGVDASSLPSV